MNISSVFPSFKGYVPVKYMARHPVNGKYVHVMKNENIRKCQGFVVRNLNGTAKNQKNTDFVEFYSSKDADYRKNPVVHSVYDNEKSLVYMVSGSDTDVVRELAKPIGVAKGEAKDKFGKTDSWETYIETKKYFKSVKDFLRYRCKRLKSAGGKGLSLIVYFTPIYSRNDKLKGFSYDKAEFVEDV